MYSAVDTIWVLIGTVLVFFMQAGFAMVETGFTRAKNAGNIIMKNLMDFALGTLVFWFIGFGIMFASSNPLFGGFDFFIQNDYGSTIPSSVFIIFQTVFCATAATIVSGAMAERTKFSSYCLYSIVISALIYPISGHWIWGGGWLSTLSVAGWTGFHDFAGSTAVHMVGGVAACIGAMTLGPRIGKYNADRSANAIPGHSLTLGALGVFILWFCWFGFNGGSTLGATGDELLVAMGNIFVNTNLAAAAAAACVMLLTWSKYGKPDVSMTLNGALGGLVAITAGCDMVTPLSSVIIGIVAGFAVVYSIAFIDQRLRIDDPVGAIGVHGVCGALGTILVGIFATEGGLLYGGGFGFLAVQSIGVISVIAWVGVSMSLVFAIIKATVGLRVSEAEELVGLDLEEHGLESSYADFVVSPGGFATSTPDVVLAPAQATSPAPSVLQPTMQSSNPKLSKVVVVCNTNRFEEVKSTLHTLGITGLTVSNVMGYGIQRGHKHYYRGVPLEANLLPKVKFEMIVSAIPVETIVEKVRSILYTGNQGDGKIFVYDVENAIRVSTGEQGYDALQDAVL